MQEGKPEDPGKPMEASLDWKPNAHKCQNRGSNPGLIGAKRRKIRYANLLPHWDMHDVSLNGKENTSLETKKSGGQYNSPSGVTAK